MVLYYNCKFNLINLKQGAHIHQPIARPVPHACTEPYQPGSAVAAKQDPCPGHYYRLNSTKLESNLVPRFSLLPSVGTDRREPWQRGWL